MWSVIFRILIVDDSVLIRRLVRSCIQTNTDWEICGEADNGRIGVEKVGQLKPDVVILDFSMPVMNGLDAAREMTRIAPRLKMVLYTMHSSEQLVKEARLAGIHHVISKLDSLEDHLLATLRAIFAGWQGPTERAV